MGLLVAVDHLVDIMGSVTEQRLCDVRRRCIVCEAEERPEETLRGEEVLGACEDQSGQMALHRDVRDEGWLNLAAAVAKVPPECYLVASSYLPLIAIPFR